MNLARRLLFVALFVLGTARGAGATCGSIPYLFQNTTGTNSLVDANTTNANNSYFQSCVTTVDNTQIGTAGIFASQIKPLTVAQATFGGSQSYTFPAGVTSATGLFNAPTGVALQLGANNGVQLTISTSGAGAFTGAFSAANGFSTTSSTNAFTFGNAAGGANSTGFNASAGSTVAGIVNTAFGVAANGVTSLLSMNGFGDLGVMRNIVPGVHLNQSVSGNNGGKFTLAAGTISYTYPNAYNVAPVVVCTPETPGTGGTIYISSNAPTGFQATSTNAADSRLIDCVFLGNPN